MNHTLSIVIPMYNEAENVAPMLATLHQGLANYSNPWELICVDDGSYDATAKLLKQEAVSYGTHVRILCHRRNFGQTAAMQTGIDAARGKIIATLDGDLQNDPADIPRMVDELLSQDLDLLAGWRKMRHDEATRKIFSRIANHIIAKITGVKLHDYGCSLKVYRAEVLKEIILFGEMHRFIPVWM
ncbi:family 2 glycosyl transferase, partial [Achromatium sp. WMS3]